MRIDNFYFVVKDLINSREKYNKRIEKKPTNIIKNRWADWKNEDGKIYFGISSIEATGEKRIKGNNGVLGLYTDNIEKSFNQCKKIGAKILYDIEKVTDSIDNYTCFAIEDLDGNKIEISQYNK